MCECKKIMKLAKNHGKWPVCACHVDTSRCSLHMFLNHASKTFPQLAIYHYLQLPSSVAWLAAFFIAILWAMFFWFVCCVCIMFLLSPLISNINHQLCYSNINTNKNRINVHQVLRYAYCHYWVPCTYSSWLREMELEIIHNLSALTGQSAPSRCSSNQLRPQTDVVPVKYDEMRSVPAWCLISH